MPKKEEAYEKIRADTRDKIINAAISVFAKNGYSKTNISDIAEVANISVGLMYRYFQSKQDLFDKIIDIAISGIQEIVEFLSSDGSPKKTMETFCQIIIESMDDETYINLNLMIIHGQLSVDTSAYQKILTEDERLINAVEKLIKKGQKQGDFIDGDPIILTSLLFSAIQGMILMKTALVNYFKTPKVAELMAFLIKQ